MKKTKSTYLALIAFLLSPMADADIILTGDTTIDTELGLEFLHIPEYTATSDYGTALAGITHDGFAWTLATVEQFLDFISNVTGVPLDAWDGTNHQDTDFSAPQAQLMMQALGYGSGVNAVTDGPFVFLNGGSFGETIFGAHTECCDDFHIYTGSQLSSWPGLKPGFYVKGSSVPEPGTLALLGIGLLGMGAARRRKKA